VFDDENESSKGIIEHHQFGCSHGASSPDHSSANNDLTPAQMDL